MANLAHLPPALQSVYEWQYQGACAGLGSEYFFLEEAERGERKRFREQRAKAICGTCPVMAQCLAHALSAREDYGVWGGMTQDERAALRRTPTTTTPTTTPAVRPLAS